MIALAAVSAIQFLGMLAILAGPAARACKSVRGWIVAAWAISQAVLVVGMLLRFSRVTRHFPTWVAGWGRGAVIIWAFFSVLMLGAYFVLRLIPAPRREHSPARRSFLFAARAA